MEGLLEGCVLGLDGGLVLWCTLPFEEDFQSLLVFLPVVVDPDRLFLFNPWLVVAARLDRSFLLLTPLFLFSKELFGCVRA